MVSLYLDCSEHLVIGLLNDQLEWISYLDISEKKSSSQIHLYLYDLLLQQGVELDQVQTVYQCSGPGSYTGMRISQGLGEMLGFLGKEIINFYHFEVPKLLGIAAGAWVANAFKGEVFCYLWKQETQEMNLLTFEEALHLRDDFSHCFSMKSCEKFLQTEVGRDLLETHHLIKENAPQLFSQLKLLKWVREPYYYRPLEVEFKVTASGKQDV